MGILSLLLLPEKLFELGLEGGGDDLFDARLVVHEEIGAGDHDPERRTEQGDEQGKPADERPLDRQPHPLFERV